jgi:signal peptidase I
MQGDASLPRMQGGRGLWRTVGRRVRRALWDMALPGALALLVLRYLVPPIGSGFPGVVAQLGRGIPLIFGVALFLLFSALAHYWRNRVSTGSIASMPVVAAAPLLDAKKGRRGWDPLAFPVLIASAACAALGVRAYVRPYRVVSESMVPTLEPGDLVAGQMRSRRSSGSPPPRRGDLVVFPGSAVGRAPIAGLPDSLVKRVIGLPGDRIEMQGDSPVINGWRVPSCEAGEYLYVLPDTTGHAVHGRLFVEFLEDRAYLTVHAFGSAFQGAYVVKPDEVFVLGDNRGNSMDSRSYNGGRGGGVPFDILEARVQRFLVGTQLNGDTDFGRLLAPVDRLEVRLRLEGVQVPPLSDGIARCLQNRPTDRRPPLSDHAA